MYLRLKKSSKIRYKLKILNLKVALIGLIFRRQRKLIVPSHINDPGIF